MDQVLLLPALRSQAVAVDEFMRKQGFRSATPESATTFDYIGMHLDWIWMSGAALNGIAGAAAGVFRSPCRVDAAGVKSTTPSRFPPLKSPPDYL